MKSNAWCQTPLRADQLGHVIAGKGPLWRTPEEERQLKLLNKSKRNARGGIKNLFTLRVKSSYLDDRQAHVRILTVVAAWVWWLTGF